MKCDKSLNWLLFVFSDTSGAGTVYRSGVG